MTIVLNEFPDTDPAAEGDHAASLSPNTNTPTSSAESVLEPARSWKDVRGDFFAVTLSRGYVTVTWHLGSGACRVVTQDDGTVAGKCCFINFIFHHVSYSGSSGAQGQRRKEKNSNLEYLFLFHWCRAVDLLESALFTFQKQL